MIWEKNTVHAWGAADALFKLATVGIASLVSLALLQTFFAVLPRRKSNQQRCPKTKGENCAGN